MKPTTPPSPPGSNPPTTPPPTSPSRISPSAPSRPRTDTALPPHHSWLPIRYHGRPSAISVSASHVPRASCQQPPPDDKPKDPPAFGPSKLLDFALEVGCVIGTRNNLGEPISIA